MLKPPFILAIAGGGSTYTPGIVKSLMVRLSDFPLAEIRLYDIDSARQETIAPVVEKVIRDHSQTIKFTTTSDPEVAFSGAHFVFAQMRVGQYKMREQDEKSRCVTAWWARKPAALAVSLTACALFCRW